MLGGLLITVVHQHLEYSRFFNQFFLILEKWKDSTFDIEAVVYLLFENAERRVL